MDFSPSPLRATGTAGKNNAKGAACPHNPQLGRVVAATVDSLGPMVDNLTAGWSSPVAREAHNLEVVSSNLAPATFFLGPNQTSRLSASGRPEGFF